MSRFIKKSHMFLRHAILILLILDIAVGVKLAWGLPSPKWPTAALTLLTTLAAACLAAVTTLAISETWAERERREAQDRLIRHKENSYQELLATLLKTRFPRTPGQLEETHDEHLMVAAAALTWADPQVINYICEWSEATENQSGDNVHSQLAQLSLAIRNDSMEGHRAVELTAEQIQHTLRALKIVDSK